MTQSPLTFITGNAAKVKWLQWHCPTTIEHKKIDLVEIQSLDLLEVVKFKAEQAYTILKQPLLVEDTSLTFNSMGKLPGPLIKWFVKELGIEGICRMLDAYKDRSAVASVMYGLYDGKSLHTFSAEIKGTMADHPKGENGHAWDYAFIPEGSIKTWGEMTDEEHKHTSLRAIAIKKLNNFLKNE